jgi:kinesin family protein 18/19
VVDDRMLIFDPKENEQPFFFHGTKQRSRDITKKQNKEINFVFDRVYAAESTNLDVFETSICGIFGPLLEGYNCSGNSVVRCRSQKEM